MVVAEEHGQQAQTTGAVPGDATGRCIRNNWAKLLSPQRFCGVNGAIPAGTWYG
jgi:hypothetical protein